MQFGAHITYGPDTSMANSNNYYFKMVEVKECKPQTITFRAPQQKVHRRLFPVGDQSGRFYLKQVGQIIVNHKGTKGTSLFTDYYQFAVPTQPGTVEMKWHGNNALDDPQTWSKTGIPPTVKAGILAHFKAVDGDEKWLQLVKVEVPVQPRKDEEIPVVAPEPLKDEERPERGMKRATSLPLQGDRERPFKRSKTTRF